MNDESLTPAQVASIIGVSTDTLRTWSNRKVEGRPIFGPNQLLADSVRESVERAAGAWRRYTLGDLYVGAVLKSLSSLGIPAASVRGIAREAGMSVLLAATKYQGYERLPTKIAVWPWRNGWHISILQTIEELTRVGDETVPYSLPSLKAIPGHGGAYVIVDLGHIGETVNERAIQDGIYEQLSLAQVDLFKLMFDTLDINDVIPLKDRGKPSALAQLLSEIVGAEVPFFS